MSENVSEKFAPSIPTRELERRWTAVRTSMNAQGFDCLIMQNTDHILGGYVRYFVDVPAGGYSTTVVFPVKEEMTVINHGAAGGPPMPSGGGSLGIKSQLFFPYMPTFNFTDTQAAEAVVRAVREAGYKKVGVVGLSRIQAAFYMHLRENLRSVELADATDLVDEIKAIKSPDEMVFIRKTVNIHDYLARVLGELFRPGRYTYEMRNELKRVASDLGCEGLNIAVGTDPNSPSMASTRFQDRRVQVGDKMMSLIEVSGPGGFYGEVARTWCLSEPSKALQEAFEAARQAQKLIAAMARPGANLADIWKANNEFLASGGYAPEARLLAHGQGYDMVERPSLEGRETMQLKEGMFLAIHPTAANKEVSAFCCDNFIVTADGAELLNKTPQQIFVL